MSKKPTMYDLFNDDSLWGNQTAGDLTNVEILDAKWNYITANREKAKDPKWKEAYLAGRKKMQNNSIWRESIEKRTKDPVWHAAQAERNREKAKDPIWKAKVKKNAVKLAQDPAWRAAQKAGVEKRTNDPAWRAAQAERNRKNNKPVITPWGMYEGVKAASVDSLEKYGKLVSPKWIRIRANKDCKKPGVCDGFDYISWEEYDELTK